MTEQKLSQKQAELLKTKKEILEEIRKNLFALTPKEEKVLRMRFGIGEEPSKTLKAIGEGLNITGERVRQIEAKALRRLRHPVRAKNLKGFWEKNSEKKN